MSWITKARRLRAQNKSYQAIADQVGVHKSRVHQVLKGSKHIRAPWHDQARRMRSLGASIAQIAEAVGKARSTVVPVVSDIHCPINHRRPGTPKRQFAIRNPGELPDYRHKEIEASVEAALQERAAEYRERMEVRREQRRYVEIAARVGKPHGVTASEILGKSLKAHIYKARLDFMVELRTKHHMSTPEIGRVLGHADHTAVLHGLHKVGLRGHLPAKAA